MNNIFVKKKELLFLGIAVIIMALALFFFQQKALSQINGPKSDLQEKNPLYIQRQTYGISLAVFEELPLAPKDFSLITELMHQGKYQNYAFFQEEYFLQPEFFPAFNKNSLSYWKNPSPTHYTIGGFGIYPAFQQVKLEPGQKVTAAFFIHSAFGVQTDQGARIELNETVEGISVSIREEEFLLEHSFPKFSKNWTKKIQAKISVGKNVKKGKYELKFSVKNPSEQSRQKFVLQTARQYAAIENSGASLQPTIEVRVV